MDLEEEGAPLRLVRSPQDLVRLEGARRRPRSVVEGQRLGQWAPHPLRPPRLVSRVRAHLVLGLVFLVPTRYRQMYSAQLRCSSDGLEANCASLVTAKAKSGHVPNIK